MKKLLALTLSLLLMLAVFAGCAGNTGTESTPPAQKTVIRIAGMKGPTTMGLAALLDKNDKGETQNDYEFSLKGAADEIVPMLKKGELDIAAVPANVAAVLYNNTEGGVKVLAVNTLGVLYVVERGETIESVADLKGKTIYATGKGTTPEFSLRYILEKNGIDPDKDVSLEFFGEATEVVAKLSKSEGAVAMLPQPYVTAAGNKIADLSIRLNLDEEWQKVDEDSRMVTGVVVANASFVEENPDAVKAFLSEYEASINYVNENVDEAAELIANLGIVDNAAIAKKALPYCNLAYLDGAKMQSALSGYYKVLFESNPASVGGAVPSSDFYYEN